MFVKYEHVNSNRGNGNNVIGYPFRPANPLLQGILTNSKWRKPRENRMRGLEKLFLTLCMLVKNYSKDNFQDPSYFLYAKPINHTCSTTS